MAMISWGTTGITLVLLYRLPQAHPILNFPVRELWHFLSVLGIIILTVIHDILTVSAGDFVHRPSNFKSTSQIILSSFTREN